MIIIVVLQKLYNLKYYFNPKIFARQVKLKRMHGFVERGTVQM